jgi:alpha-L-fucosidase 2
VDGVTYKREVFANAIDQVIVVRLTADKPNSISFNTMLCGITDPKKPGDEEFDTKVLKEGELVLSGKAASYCDIKGAVRYQGRAV